VFIVFGGLNATTLFNDTWEFDGTTWVPRFPSQSPSPRRRPAIAYDPVRHVTVLFGGSNVGDSVFFNDTWEYDGKNWVLRTVINPPSPRNGSTMVYDRQRGKMVLFGGYKYSTTGYIFYDETWEYDGMRWVKLSPLNHPSARETAGMVYDLVDKKTILFGGGRDAGTIVYGDTWEWDGVNWVRLTTTGSPSARWLFAITYDQFRNRIVLFGGLGANLYYLSDTWEFDSSINAWTQAVLTTKPSARTGHGMGYDLIKNRAILFGGYFYGYLNDTWEYTG
jgi:hypothetical protein